MADDQFKFWITDGALAACFILATWLLDFAYWLFYKNPKGNKFRISVKLWWRINRIYITFINGKMVYWGFGRIEIIDLKTFEVKHYSAKYKP